MVRSSIAVALKPVDCKPVTLVERELSKFLETLLELALVELVLVLRGTSTNANTITIGNTKFLLLLC